MWLVEANTTCSGHGRTHARMHTHSHGVCFHKNFNDSPWKAKLPLNADSILTSLNSIPCLQMMGQHQLNSVKWHSYVSSFQVEWEHITFVTWCSVDLFNLPNDTLNSTSVLLDQRSNLLYEPRVRCTSALLDYFYCVASFRFVFKSCFPCTAGHEGCWSPFFPTVIGYRRSSPWTSQ